MGASWHGEEAKREKLTKEESEILKRILNRQVIIDFLYWREKDIHPSDAHNLVTKYFNQQQIT